MHDKSTNTSGASVVEAKGTAPFAVTDVARSLQCIGHSGVINKSDGALSVKVQKQKAEGQAEIKSSPEESSPAERENLRTLVSIREDDLRSCGRAQNGKARQCNPWVRTSQVSRSSRCDAG